MLPTMRNRLLITLTVLLGGGAWLLAARTMTPADSSTGLSLFASRSGVPMAILAAVLAGIPATLLGLVSAAGGHPLAGVFSTTASLALAAATRGRMLGWFQRHAGAGSLPDAYATLMLETVLWFAGLVVMLMAIQYLRSPLRSRIPTLASHDHFGRDTYVRFPNAKALAAGAVTAIIGWLLCVLLVRSDATGQVVCSLVLGFALAATAGQLIFRQANPVAILLSPMVVAIVGYGFARFGYDSSAALERAWYAGRIVGPAMVLPVFYVSAGVAGCAIGVGLAQGFTASHQADATSAVSSGSVAPASSPSDDSTKA